MANAEFNGEKFGAYLVIPFFVSDLTTQESNKDLLVGVTPGTVYVAPRSGSVVAISAACAAITAGTVTLTPHKASTEFANAGVPQPVLSSDNDTNGTYADVREHALTFVAGDTLGISATSTTTLNPTNTLDVSAFLHIQLDPG